MWTGRTYPDAAAALCISTLDGAVKYGFPLLYWKTVSQKSVSPFLYPFYRTNPLNVTQWHFAQKKCKAAGIKSQTGHNLYFPASFVYKAAN